MKDKKLFRILDIIFYVICAALVWIAISSTIYNFVNPEKTAVESFLHIPKSFILEFSK